MIVISDASPLIALSAVGRLSLLRELYGRVLVPAAVHHEVVRDPGARSGAREVAEAEWIEVREVVDAALVMSLVQGGIGRGESEAIALAVEEHAGILLLDDLRARQAASSYGLTITGVIGIFLLAKKHGLIAHVKPLLDGIVATIGFRIASSLYDDVLRSAGEL